MNNEAYVLPLDALRMTDVAKVGGKNASLGEMRRELTQYGVNVPNGFAVTVNAPPVITAQPEDQNVYPGGNATFSVTACERRSNRSLRSRPSATACLREMSVVACMAR